MSDQFKSIIDASYDNGTPLWISTKDYIYGMVPAGGDRWTEISYTFEDPDEPLVATERNADISFQLMVKELTMGVSFYVEDLNIQTIKDFAQGLEGQGGSDKINAMISELVSNTGAYSANLPIIKSKDEALSLKDKV